MTAIPEGVGGGGGGGGGGGAATRLQGDDLLKDPMAQLFGTVKVQVLNLRDGAFHTLLSSILHSKVFVGNAQPRGLFKEALYTVQAFTLALIHAFIHAFIHGHVFFVLFLFIFVV